jgi:hypothetical protein
VSSMLHLISLDAFPFPSQRLVRFAIRKLVMQRDNASAMNHDCYQHHPITLNIAFDNKPTAPSYTHWSSVWLSNSSCLRLGRGWGHGQLFLERANTCTNEWRGQSLLGTSFFWLFSTAPTHRDCPHIPQGCLDRGMLPKVDMNEICHI